LQFNPKIIQQNKKEPFLTKEEQQVVSSIKETNLADIEFRMALLVGSLAFTETALISKTKIYNV
jgi:hypothetical protein